MDNIITWLIELDTTVFLFLNGLHADFLDPVMKLISGKFVWVPFYLFLTYCLMQRAGWRRGLLCLVFIGLAITATDQIGASVIRPVVERMRPSNPDNPISAMVHIVDGYRGGRYGFPSCHAGNTFALATFLSLLFQRRAVTCGMFAWAAVVSYSRIYLGVHYTGDIIVGAMLGSANAILFWYLAEVTVQYTPLLRLRLRER